MSDIVKDLLTAIETRMAAVIGSDYKKLDYVFDITKNSLNRDFNRYGVRALGFTSETGTTCRTLTVDQDFELIISTRFVNRQGEDIKQRDAVNDLFKRLYLVINDLFLTKLGKPDTVMSVNRVNVDNPEFLDDENVTVIRGRIGVKYRQILS